MIIDPSRLQQVEEFDAVVKKFLDGSHRVMIIETPGRTCRSKCKHVLPCGIPVLNGIVIDDECICGCDAYMNQCSWTFFVNLCALFTGDWQIF